MSGVAIGKGVELASFVTLPKSPPLIFFFCIQVIVVSTMYCAIMILYDSFIS